MGSSVMKKGSTDMLLAGVVQRQPSCLVTNALKLPSPAAAAAVRILSITSCGLFALFLLEALLTRHFPDKWQGLSDLLRVIVGGYINGIPSLQFSMFITLKVSCINFLDVDMVNNTL
jgi:hypothetical protein